MPFQLLIRPFSTQLLTPRQLRDLLICPRERGVVHYVQNESIIEHNILTPHSVTHSLSLFDPYESPDSQLCQKPRSIADLRFTPNTLASLPIDGTDDVLVAAGGQDAEIHLSLHDTVPSSSS